MKLDVNSHLFVKASPPFPTLYRNRLPLQYNELRVAQIVFMYEQYDGPIHSSANVEM